VTAVDRLREKAHEYDVKAASASEHEQRDEALAWTAVALTLYEIADAITGDNEQSAAP
jgi:hypothetical protein